MKASRLKAIPVVEQHGNRSTGIRQIKMLYPRCDECSGNGRNWWMTCPHDKYHQTQVEEIRTPILATDEDGDEIVADYKVKRKFRRIPNVRQVPLTTKIGSGLEVERALTLGCRFPQDVDPYPPGFEGEREFDGYAPMCEMNNCYAANPTVKARHPELLEENPFTPQERANAAYCSEMHAKLVIFKERGKTREVYDKKKRSSQIQEISI